MDHERKSCKVAESSYQVLKVALSIAQEWITKEKGVKFRSLYIKCFKLRGSSVLSHEWISNQKVVKLRSLYMECLKFSCLCIISGSPKKKFKNAECLYQVFKVALYMCQEWITKDKVVKLRSLFIKCLKLCVLSIMSVSPKTKL